MAATSEEFKAALKENRIVDALKTALGQSIELEITTRISSSNPQIGSRTRDEEDSGEIMRTRLNIVEGKIETEIGSKFVEGGKFAELRDFHVSQMQASGQIIERNITSLQKLLELWVGMQQTVVVTDSKTPSPELKTIQPGAIASGSSDGPAAFGRPDPYKEEPVTTRVTEQTERTREPELPEDDDAEVLAAFELDEPSTDGLAFNTEAPEIAAAEKDEASSALKTAAVVAGTAAVVGTAAAAAAAVWGSREDEAASDSESEAFADIDELDEAATDPTPDPLGELETEELSTSSWDETELLETTPPEEPVLSEDPEALVESIPELEPVEDSELEMMDGTQQLASSWDETELMPDEPEPEAIEPDLLAETLVESAIDEDEPVIQEFTEDSEVEIMGAFETEESGSTPAKEDETAEILGSLDTEEELAASWDGTELPPDTEAESPVLGIDPASADPIGTAEDELAASWEEPEDSWETALQDDSMAIESEMSLVEESAEEWPTALEDESLADSEAAEEWPTALEDESLADSEAAEEWPTALEDETVPTDASDEGLADVFDSSEMAMTDESDPFGEPEAAPLGSDEDLPLWEEPETDPLADSLDESSELLEMPVEAADDDALGMNDMAQNQELENLWDEEAAPAESAESNDLELPDSEFDAFAGADNADNADPFFASEMSDDEEFAELDSSTVDDEDAALMNAFDSDAEADLGFDEPQPYPGTTGADLGLDGEVLETDVFSEDMSASEFAQAAEETSASMLNTEDMALDESDLDIFGSGDEPQGNGTQKATATAGDNSSDDEELDDPLAALLADDDDADDPLGQAGVFESEAEFDPLAELFASSDQEEDINSGSEETDELDALFSDDLNGGNLEDPFADLELAESSSQQKKKKR